MHGKLRHREAFQLVHFSRLVDLLLQVGPFLPDLLARGADFFLSRILYLVRLAAFSLAGTKRKTPSGAGDATVCIATRRPSDITSSSNCTWTARTGEKFAFIACRVRIFLGTASMADTFPFTGVPTGMSSLSKA